MANDGVEEVIVELARRLRSDIDVQVRPFHLKQCLDQLGPGLPQLEDYYCLSAVTLPYGRKDIEAATEEKERYWMEEVCCQIDLGVSADVAQQDDETDLNQTAGRALGVNCGLVLSDDLWTD